MSTADLVPDSFVDAYRKRRPIAPKVREAVLAAMRLTSDEVPPAAGRVVVARPGKPLPEPGEVVLEDRTRLGRIEALAPDTPFGYHHFTRDDGSDALLIAGPGRCLLPTGLTSATCASSPRGRAGSAPAS
jgi:hypothetical protein